MTCNSIHFGFFRCWMPSGKSHLSFEINIEAPESQTTLYVSEREALQAIGCWRKTFVQLVLLALKAFRVLSTDRFWVGEVSGDKLRGSKAWFLTWFVIIGLLWNVDCCPSKDDDLIWYATEQLSFQWNGHENGDVDPCKCITSAHTLQSYLVNVYTSNCLLTMVIKIDTFQCNDCIWKYLSAHTFCHVLVRIHSGHKMLDACVYHKEFFSHSGSFQLFVVNIYVCSSLW